MKRLYVTYRMTWRYLKTSPFLWAVGVSALIIGTAFYVNPPK